MDKIKSSDNIMGRKTKLQKSREMALGKLKSIGGKLHTNTYWSYYTKILSRQMIPAINKIANELDQLNATRERKLTYPKIKTQLQVNQFNQSGEMQTFDQLDPEKLKAILRNIDTSQKTMMEIGDIDQGNYRTYALTPQRLTSLLNAIDEFWFEEVEAVGSDESAVVILKDVDRITLYRPKAFNKDHNEGAFFKYYNKTSIDSTKFGCEMAVKWL